VKCLVLTYHSQHIAGKDYSSNDHVALAADLEVLHRRGAEVVPLTTIAAAVACGSVDSGSHMQVGISFDDGPVFDYRDFIHPAHGPQRSFLNILRDFRKSRGPGALPGLHATSFVIASPEARLAMERSPSSGYTFLSDWLADDWWRPAAESGFMDIGNHTWDHVHHAAPKIAIGKDARDNFEIVDNFADAEAEIRPAAEYINAKIGRMSTLFAFPFGHVNDYLVRDYLPTHGPSLGLEAAFGLDGLVKDGDAVWSIPRLACGRHWHTPEEFERLIAPRRPPRPRVIRSSRSARSNQRGGSFPPLPLTGTTSR
jgi:Polysaccharide deacetylase